MTPNFFFTWSLAAMLLATGPAAASDGHDHGNASSAAAGPASPRFAAVSDTFELVGVLNGKHLTLYLDRFADNSPVKDARLDLEIDGVKLKAEPHGEGEFEATLAAQPRAGVLSVIAGVGVGNESDLLAGELDIHADAHEDAAANGRDWKAIAGWAFGGVATLALLVRGARRMGPARERRAGGAA
ncbi:hypothetical protein [Variovorax sp. dw_308]|uniref:hypothetical protein n=1 Tax=Variovorax sp. dw_308 TaxID=2721546 RepID=UPI001C471230|nr:hypothetical protein [Variovorax sp. dw_308]